MLYQFGIGALPATYPIAPRNIGSVGLLTPTHPTIVATGTFQAPGISTNSVGMSIKGSTNKSWVASQKLYIKGVPTGASMNLFVATDDAPTTFFSCPLSIRSLGTGITGTQGVAFLATKGYFTANTASMNMFVEGAERGSPTGSMSMAIVGGNYKIAGSIPLIIVDNIQRAENTLDLFIRAPGTNPGYVPLDTTMDMYVERGPTGGITLYIGRDVPANQAPLFIAGKPLAQDSTDLYVKGEGGIYTASTDLVIPNVMGATQINGQLILVIPDVIGDPRAITNLYVGGWK